jgi:hypothetical protein
VNWFLKSINISGLAWRYTVPVPIHLRFSIYTYMKFLIHINYQRISCSEIPDPRYGIQLPYGPENEVRNGSGQTKSRWRNRRTKNRYPTICFSEKNVILLPVVMQIVWFSETTMIDWAQDGWKSELPVSALPAAAAPRPLAPLTGRTHAGRALPAHHSHTQPSPASQPGIYIRYPSILVVGTRDPTVCTVPVRFGLTA